MILRTTDGGTTWSRQSSGLSDPFDGINFFGVHFINATTGTLSAKKVLSSGRRTAAIAGCNKWSDTTDWLYAVHFADENHGTAVGFLNGTILTTTDGGQSWVAQASGTSGLLGVYFTDSNTGAVVGNDGAILKTTDGGQNWTAQNSGTTNQLRAVSFTDANTGTVVGDQGTILRTTDGGQHWAAQTSGVPTYSWAFLSATQTTEPPSAN